MSYSRENVAMKTKKLFQDVGAIITSTGTVKVGDNVAAAGTVHSGYFEDKEWTRTIVLGVVATKAYTIGIKITNKDGTESAATAIASTQALSTFARLHSYTVAPGAKFRIYLTNAEVADAGDYDVFMQLNG